MRKTVIILVLLVSAGFVFGQQSEKSVHKSHVFRHSVFIGYNLGGLAPVILPENIRSIEHYSPGFSPSLGYEVFYSFAGRWWIGAGVRADWKSMKVRDSVQYFHTMVSVDDASVEGDFSGTNTTNVKNIYLTIPVYASYLSKNHWRLKLGFYMSQMIRSSFYGTVSDGYLRRGNSLGEKIIIDHASFNFDMEQRKFDYGLITGAEKLIYKQFAIKGDLQWGLRPVFPNSFSGISFNMYNIYGTIGISYQF